MTELLTTCPEAPPPPGLTDPAYSPTQTKILLGVSIDTLNKWRRLGIGPAYTQPVPGGGIYYLRSDIDAWLRAGRRQSTRDDTAEHAAVDAQPVAS